MIPISLVEEPVEMNDYKFLLGDDYEPFLFLGFVIKNEYDNQRLKIDERYDPQKICVVKHATSKAIPLYGIVLSPNSKVRELINIVKEQHKTGPITLSTYKNLLSQYSLSCEHTYYYFNDAVLPIDFTNLKAVCDEPISNDKKIFQHLLSLDDEHFDFQSFAALKLFIVGI